MGGEEEERKGGGRKGGRQEKEGRKNARHPKHSPLGWYFTSLSPLRKASCLSMA